MSDNITIMGNLAAEPERRRTAGGTPVTTFRVASSQRHFDKEKDSWIESGTNWYQVSAFRSLAEHTAASLHKGDRVIVTGRLKLRHWETDKGKGLSVEIDADGVGHDLLWGTTSYTKTTRGDAWPASGAAGADAEAGAAAGTGEWPTAIPGESNGPATSAGEKPGDWGALSRESSAAPADDEEADDTEAPTPKRELMDTPF